MFSRSDFRSAVSDIQALLGDADASTASVDDITRTRLLTIRQAITAREPAGGHPRTWRQAQWQARQRLLRRDYHPRRGDRRLAAGIIVGAAGVALVIGLGVSGVFGSASHPAHARLAAWTVTKEADGRIFLKIRELRDPAALQRKLRADGVPASVVFHPGPPVANPSHFLQFKGNPCQEYSGGEGQAQNVVRGGSPLTGMFLYPSAIPNGAGVQIVATRNVGGPPFPLFEWLVQASPPCTGS